MSALTDLTGTVATSAAGPLSASQDGASATARPIADIIAANNYLAATAAAAQSRRRGLRFTKLIPAGALSDSGMIQGVIPTPWGPY